MIYGSVCSGIEAATVAWEPLGWKPAFFSEIEAFPRAVLKHHYPDVPLHGDFTTIEANQYGAIDILVGGTPCQDFSIAGLRAGIAGDRGNLTLEFLRLAARTEPRWIVWENVPGVLSSDGGRALGAFLGGLAELGYGFAYRVLDAQYFGLAQRRARVFVVGYLGDWRRAAAVLFERESLLWDHPPRRQTGEGVAPTISARTKGGGGLGTDFDCDGGLIAFGQNNTSGPVNVSHALQAHPGPAGRMDFGSETFLVDIAHSLRAEGFDASEDGTGRGTPPVAHAFDARQSDVIQYGDKTGPLDTDGHTIGVLAFTAKDHGADAGAISPTLRGGGHHNSHANGGVMPAVCFDTTQMTSKANRSNPKAGDPCHPLAAGAHPPAVAFSIMPMNSGKDYKARPTDIAQPVMAGGPVGGNQGGDFIAGTAETMYGISHADAPETGPVKALRALRDAVAPETLTLWCLGILAAFWPAEVLRPEVHGGGIRCQAQPKRGLVNVALSRSQAGAVWSVQDLWEAGCDGRTPQGWRPSEQLARQLGAYLSELPYSPSPASCFVRDMWRASEGLGLLRQALSAVQDARRSACGEDQPAHGNSAVRRLTVEECEALQGFPRGYTNVPYRSKPASDGPRYKALGNSMAVPVMAWIGERIAMVERLVRGA